LRTTVVIFELAPPPVPSASFPRKLARSMFSVPRNCP
jgi:hypothetical protein